MCACTEPVRTGIGAVCVEYGRPKWPITMLNHTDIPGTEKCFDFFFWYPMLLRPAMKTLFCLKAKKDANTTCVFFLRFVHVTFRRVLYNIHHIAFAEELTNSAAAAAADLHPFVTHTGLTVKTALFLLLIVTHSSSMKGPRLNFYAARQLARQPKTTFFLQS